MSHTPDGPAGDAPSPAPPDLLARCRVVLVRTQIAGNLGATARVMRNMGLSELVLVAPEADRDDRQARQLSTHGEEILDRARVVDDLGAALADCVLAVGTSARVGGPLRRQSVALPEEVLPLLLDGAEAGPVALVFGPERTGLLDVEVTRCHHLLHIPSDETYAALNLAQAVAIALYELRRAWLRRGASRGTAPAPQPPAPLAEQERMFEQLREGLEAIHFVYGHQGDALMHAVRHLLGRAGPTAMEVGVLFGLARQLRWVAGQARRAGPAEGD